MLPNTVVFLLALLAVDAKLHIHLPVASQCLRHVLAHVGPTRSIQVLPGDHYADFKGQLLIGAPTLAEAPQVYWIASQSINVLNLTLKALVESSEYKLATFVIVADPTTEQSVVDILWKLRLLDSLVVSPHGIYALELIECGASVRAKKVGTCKSPDLQVFDFKQGFLGCPLRVLWVRYPPYMYEPNQTSGWKGIFVDFLEVVSHGLQRPIELAPSDEDYLDEVYQGYSYDSVLQDLQEADLFIGTTDTRTAGLFYLSPIIVGDFIVILAPRALVDYWSHFRRAVSLRLLTMFGVMFFSMAAVLFGLSQLRDRARRIADIVMLLYGVSMGLSGHARLPNYSALRIFLGLFLVVLMVLSFYLQGTLTSVLSGPSYEPSISSIEELVASGLPLKLTELFKLVFEFGTGSYQKPHMLELAKRIEVLEEPLMLNVLDTMIRDRSFATLMINAFMFMRPNLEGTFGSFPVGNIDLCFAMGKNSYSSPPLNAWIARALEAGFFEKFKRLHHFELALKWHVEAAGRAFVVSWSQIAPALIVLQYGFGSAFVALLLELLLANLR